MSRMSEQERKETRQEAKILSVLKHPSIVNFREVFTTVSNKLCIVMDYADGGDLQNKIKEAKGRFFPEAQILDWMTQICLGLKHVHDRKILHRDIKAQNIFLTQTKRCLLGDFGIAKILSSTKGFARTVVGTPYYLSPEILESQNYSFQSDIWSLGVLLYELCALKPPFDAPSLPLLAMKIVRGNFAPLSPHYSRELRGLVTQMLQVDPGKRPSIHQVLKMGFIQARVKSFLSETEYTSEFSHTVLHGVGVLGKENKQPKGSNDSAVFGLPADYDRKAEKKRQERKLKEKEMAEKRRIEELQKKIEEENEKKRIEEAERKRLEELNKMQREEEKRRQERREEVARLKDFNAVLPLNSPKPREKRSAQIVATPIVQPVVKKNSKALVRPAGRNEARRPREKQSQEKGVSRRRGREWEEQRKRMKEDIRRRKMQPKKLSVEVQCDCVVPNGTSEDRTQPASDIGQKIDSSEEESKKKAKKTNKNKTKAKLKKQLKDNPELDCEEKVSVPVEVNEEGIRQEEIEDFMLMREEMQRLISNFKDESPKGSAELPAAAQESFDEDRDDIAGLIEEDATPTPKEDTKVPIEESKAVFKAEPLCDVNEYGRGTDVECVAKYLEGIFGGQKVKEVIKAITRIVSVSILTE